MNTLYQQRCNWSLPGAQQLAANALVCALETGLTSTSASPDGRRVLAFTFVDEQHLQAACDAWRGYTLSLIDAPAPLAVTGAQRAVSHISEALFGDPTLDLVEISNRLRGMKGRTDAPLLTPLSALQTTSLAGMEVTHERG